MLEGVSALVTTETLVHYLPSRQGTIIQWAWLLRALLLSGFLFVACRAGAAKVTSGRPLGAADEIKVFILAAVYVAAFFALIALVPLAEMARGGWALNFVREIIPAALFGAARKSSRISNEGRGGGRVTYDISSKPPATVEWE